MSAIRLSLTKATHDVLTFQDEADLRGLPLTQRLHTNPLGGIGVIDRLLDSGSNGLQVVQLPANSSQLIEYLLEQLSI